MSLGGAKGRMLARAPRMFVWRAVADAQRLLQGHGMPSDSSQARPDAALFTPFMAAMAARTAIAEVDTSIWHGAVQDGHSRVLNSLSQSIAWN